MVGGHHRAVIARGLRAIGWLWLLPIGPSCSPNADTVCSADGNNGVSVSSPQLSRQVLLSRADTRFSTRLDVKISRLPEVWSATDTLYLPRLTVNVSLAYVDPQPVGAELPPVTVTLAHEEPDAVFPPESATATAGGPPGSRPTAVLNITPFEVCWSDDLDRACCPFGSESCAGRVVLALSI